MARFVDPLVVGRVIGEVVDLFVPSISMTVAYDGAKDISNGCLLKPSATSAPPIVRISGRRNDLYTLIMTDPDAPSPSDPTMREYLHWHVQIVANIPGGTDATRGDEVVAYMGPRPPVGIHRYVLMLFQQKTRVVAEAPGERANFNTRAFAARHELGLPTAVVYFNAQKEPANRRR